MQEFESMLELFRRAQADGRALYVATVVYVQGSAYRKPGARMLVCEGGERAGHISGGCLEAEVGRRIAWLTRDGACLKAYSSSFDDDSNGVSYGLGCNGTVWVLLEKGHAVTATMLAVERAVLHQKTSCIALAFSKESTGTAIIARSNLHAEQELFAASAALKPSELAALRHCIRGSFASGRAHLSSQTDSLGFPRFVCLPIAASSKVTVFGAGDDARPLVAFMQQLGWRVTVADGRHHLLTRQRFTEKAILWPLRYEPNSSGSDETISPAVGPPLGPQDSAVILTHSYVQDRALLQHLLPVRLRYLGILGPLHRTERLLRSICPLGELTFETCLHRLHAPVGLHLGSDDPSVIALSIVAEIQAAWAGTTGCVERCREGACLLVPSLSNGAPM